VPELSWIVVQCYLVLPFVEDISNVMLADMTLGNMAPDILVWTITEKIEYSLVGPYNAAIRGNTVEAKWHVVKEDSHRSKAVCLFEGR